MNQTDLSFFIIQTILHFWWICYICTSLLHMDPCHIYIYTRLRWKATHGQCIWTLESSWPCTFILCIGPPSEHWTQNSIFLSYEWFYIQTSVKHNLDIFHLQRMDCFDFLSTWNATGVKRLGMASPAQIKFYVILEVLQRKFIYHPYSVLISYPTHHIVYTTHSSIWCWSMYFICVELLSHLFSLCVCKVMMCLI